MCLNRFSKFPSAQITSGTSSKSVINFLRKYITLHGLPRTVKTDQGSEFIFKEVQKFCQERNINFKFNLVGDHRATCLVKRVIRQIKKDDKRNTKTLSRNSASENHKIFKDCNSRINKLLSFRSTFHQTPICTIS